MNQEKINKFEEFHQSFLGDVKSLNCSSICNSCENNCETINTRYNYLIYLLPDEDMFLYQNYKLENLNFDEFKNKYIFGLSFSSDITGLSNDYIINFLKIGKYCQFFGYDNHCLFGEKKPISCKIFPIMHHPIVGYKFNYKCSLTYDLRLYIKYTESLKFYKKLLDDLELPNFFIYILQFIDNSNIDIKSPIYKDILKKNIYQVIPYEKIKKYFIIKF